jgi:hypothetical protein
MGKQGKKAQQEANLRKLLKESKRLGLKVTSAAPQASSNETPSHQRPASSRSQHDEVDSAAAAASPCSHEHEGVSEHEHAHEHDSDSEMGDFEMIDISLAGTDYGDKFQQFFGDNVPPTIVLGLGQMPAVAFTFPSVWTTANRKVQRMCIVGFCCVAGAPSDSEDNPDVLVPFCDCCQDQQVWMDHLECSHQDLECCAVSAPEPCEHIQHMNQLFSEDRQWRLMGERDFEMQAEGKQGSCLCGA